MLLSTQKKEKKMPFILNMYSRYRAIMLSKASNTRFVLNVILVMVDACTILMTVLCAAIVRDYTCLYILIHRNFVHKCAKVLCVM